MENINIRVIEQNRAQINKFGTVFGTGVFTPRKEQVITDFNSRKQNMTAHDLFITRNIHRFKIGVVNITGVNYAKDADGEDIVRISGVDPLGKEVTINCEVTKPTFTQEPTTDSLREAFESGKTAFFKSGRKMKDEINSLNNKELARINALIEELEAARETVKSTIDANNQKVDEYYNQLDKKSGNTSVHLRMTVEE